MYGAVYSSRRGQRFSYGFRNEWTRLHNNPDASGEVSSVFPVLNERAVLTVYRIGIRQRNFCNISIGTRAFSRFTIVHIVMLPGGISPYDEKIRAGAQVFVRDTGWNHHYVPCFD